MASGGFQAFVLSAYGALGSAFVNISPDYQWLLAVVSPLFREILTWATFQINYKVVGKHEKMSIKLPILHYMATKYAIFLSIIVAGSRQIKSGFC